MSPNLKKSSPIKEDTALLSHESKKRPEPPIFTLPQNPIALSHYKYNFVRNKIELNRIEGLAD